MYDGLYHSRQLARPLDEASQRRLTMRRAGGQHLQR
jgi:hypothetical protein